MQSLTFFLSLSNTDVLGLYEPKNLTFFVIAPVPMYRDYERQKI